MAELVVDNAEFARQAQKINNCAKQLEVYIGYLANHLVDLHHTGAIASEAMLSSFEDIHAELASLAQSTRESTATVVAKTNEYIFKMDEFDDFPE